MTSLQVVADKVLAATSYRDVFTLVDVRQAPDSVAREYRSYAKVLHPDRYTSDADKKYAADLFVRLGELKAGADDAIRSGIFGETQPSIIMTTRRASYNLNLPMLAGDICATYQGSAFINGRQTPLFFKVARSSDDRDLLQNEATALKRLHGDTAEKKWQRHVPMLQESFAYEERGTSRQVTVTSLFEGFVTLEAVATAFRRGVDPRHGVWIFRRLLMALGFAHDNHIVHGAVVPSHVMILPKAHGLVLVDWCYASIADESGVQPAIKAIVEQYWSWYPEEVFAKQAPSPATDIAMAVRTIIYLMGGNPLTGELPMTIPRPLRAYLKGCLQTKQLMRPQNAWLLLEEFDGLLETMGAPYYPRHFLTFAMPHGVA
jgi:serine/threonine protein kinase